MRACFLGLLLAACATTDVTVPPTCALDVPEVVDAPTPLTSGVSVTVRTSPLTTLADTVVTVGSLLAEVEDVTRQECEACDSCRTDNVCTTCGVECAACADVCGSAPSYGTAACVETVRFTVPELAAGTYPVVIQNGVGVSEAGSFEIADGTTDTAAP
jgi:hypothetical protein